MTPAIPADEPLNIERARLAERALVEYSVAVGCGSTGAYTDTETLLYDLLAGLRHFARERDLDFDLTSDAAATFYGQSLVAPDGWVSLLEEHR